jgi:hypothetical protein
MVIASGRFRGSTFTAVRDGNRQRSHRHVGRRITPFAVAFAAANGAGLNVIHDAGFTKAAEKLFSFQDDWISSDSSRLGLYSNRSKAKTGHPHSKTGLLATDSSGIKMKARHLQLKVGHPETKARHLTTKTICLRTDSISLHNDNSSKSIPA